MVFFGALPIYLEHSLNFSIMRQVF